MTPEMATAIIVALGGASLVPKIFDGIIAWRTGKAAAEKNKNRSALGRLVEAEERADDEAEYARAMERFAARLERMLIQLGVPEDKMPAWPTRDKETA